MTFESMIYRWIDSDSSLSFGTHTCMTHTLEVPWALGDMMDSFPITTGGPNRFPDMLFDFVVSCRVLSIVE
jgi:hypothetical protein